MSRNNEYFQPLTPELQMKLAALCGIIDNTLNHNNMEDKEVAFALMLFPTGEEPNGEAVYLSGSPRKEMCLAIQLWLNKQLQRLENEEQETPLHMMKPLLEDAERKLLLDRRLNDAAGYEGEERREAQA